MRAEQYLGNAVPTHEGYGPPVLSGPKRLRRPGDGPYLVNLTTPPKGTVCQSNQQPFDPGFGSRLAIVTHTVVAPRNSGMRSQPHGEAIP